MSESEERIPRSAGRMMGKVMPKVMLRYGSPIWFRFLRKGNPDMVPLGFHDGYVVVRHRGRIWKVIGGGPMKPTLREVYRHDFTRPA